jgi:hypothetical protein
LRARRARGMEGRVPHPGGVSEGAALIRGACRGNLELGPQCEG